jgi:hypothetical protein
MGLRKSIVFIGSVLILAACDRAGAPTGPLSLHEGAAASGRKDTTSTTTTSTSSMSDSECLWARTGDGDSVLVCSDPQ